MTLQAISVQPDLEHFLTLYTSHVANVLSDVDARLERVKRCVHKREVDDENIMVNMVETKHHKLSDTVLRVGVVRTRSQLKLSHQVTT